LLHVLTQLNLEKGCVSQQSGGVASKQFDQIIVQANRVAELPGFLNLKLRFPKMLYSFAAVFLGFGQKEDRSRALRVDPVRKRCVVSSLSPSVSYSSSLLELGISNAISL
jgi:hypothetical protein